MHGRHKTKPRPHPDAGQPKIFHVCLARQKQVGSIVFVLSVQDGILRSARCNGTREVEGQRKLWHEAKAGTDQNSRRKGP